jgi:hypothetical protein
MKPFQAMYSFVLLALCISACSHQTTPQEVEQQKQQEQQEAAATVHHNSAIAANLQLMLHVCDANGGVKDYWDHQNGLGVQCNNGLSTSVTF